MTRAAFGLAIALLFGVTSCYQAPPAQQVTAAVPPIHGRITDDYHVAASLANDIAKGATVSLIDTVTGQTKGTTVSDASGKFLLSSGLNFTPDPNRAYYMEAVKGLPVGLSANRAGAPLARVRTILFWRDGWVSLSSAVVGAGVTLSSATTALAAIVGHKGLSIADQNNLIGKVSDATFDPAGTVVAGSDFSQVYGLVRAAIADDQDPMEVIGYDAGLTQFHRRAGALVLHDGITPAKANPSGTFTVRGQNLPLTASEATVSVAQLPVATWSVDASRSTMVVTLGASHYTGHLQVTKDGSNVTGPFVPVTGTVGTLAGSGMAGYQDGRGRNAFFNNPQDVVIDAQNNLYVSDTQRIRKITPDGEVTTLAGTGLSGVVDGQGTAASFWATNGLGMDASGNILVASHGRIRRVTPSGAVTTMDVTGNFSANPASPYSFANSTNDVAAHAGAYYVVTVGDNKLWKVTVGTGVTHMAGDGTTGNLDGNITGNPTAMQLSGPRRLAIDTDGTLYISNNGYDSLRKILPNGTTMTLTTGAWQANPATRTAAPCGILLSGTQLYFGSNYSINRITTATGAGLVTAIGPASIIGGYADGLPSQVLMGLFPRALAQDSRGFLYFIDGASNALRVLVP